jgi:DNA adenine methylase
VELAERVKNLKGKFLLSLNDVPEIRRIFESFKIRRLELPYSSQRQAGKIYQELLISNYSLPE